MFENLVEMGWKPLIFNKKVVKYIYIFTVENLFDDVKNKLLGEQKDRNLIKDFDNFYQKNFMEIKDLQLYLKLLKDF